MAELTLKYATPSLPNHSSRVFSLAFSPDGSLLASAAMDRYVKVWEAETGKLIYTFVSHRGGTNPVKFSPDGKYLLGLTSGHQIAVWEVASGEKVFTFEGDYLAIGFNIAGELLALGLGEDYESSFLQTWDLQTGKLLTTDLNRKHIDFNSTVLFFPDGEFFIEAGLKGLVNIWNTSTGELVRTFKTNSVDLVISFDSNTKVLATGGYEKIIELWNIETGERLHLLEGHQNSSHIKALAISPDGKTLASMGLDSEIKFWDIPTGKLLKTIKFGYEVLESIKISPIHKNFAVGQGDGSIKMVSQTQEIKWVNKGISPGIVGVNFNPDGKNFANRFIVGRLEYRETATGELVWVTNIDYGSSLAFHPDGKKLAVGSKESVEILNVSDGTSQHTIDDTIASCFFSPDGNLFVIATYHNGFIKIWETVNWTLKQTIACTDIMLAFSPDSRFLASGDWRNPITLWDVETGAKVRTIRAVSEEYQDSAISIMFSPDGKYLVCGKHCDNLLYFHEVESGKLAFTLRSEYEGTQGIRIVGFSRDGTKLITADPHDSIQIWDLETRKSIFSIFPEEARGGYVAALSPDKQQLITGHHDGSVRLWEVIF